MSSLLPHVNPPALTPTFFRPFKIVGGQDGKPLVEVESEGKAAKYVRIHVFSHLKLILTMITVS